MKKLLLLSITALMSVSGYALNLRESVQSTDTIIVLKKNFDTAFFIPDGLLCHTPCYQTGIVVDTFPQGAVIRSAQDIASLCMKMEHSWSGDLSISLICPNGQKAVLMTFLGSRCHEFGVPANIPCTNQGAKFGLALANRQIPGMPFPDYCTDSLNAQGTGWQYCWSERYLNNTQGQMGPNTTKRDSIPGFSIIDSSNYDTRSKFFTPDTSFNSLIGCPLNGEWKIEVCDYWGADKGWLFEWSLGLGFSAIVPDSFSVSNVTQNEANISCQNNNNKAFIFEYKEENGIEWYSHMVFSSQIALNSLAPNTKYLMRGYSYLGDGLTKLESKIDTFKTFCHIPNTAISSVTKNSAIITFENETGNEFGFEYKKAGDTEWISQTITGMQIELNDLDAESKYEIRTCCISARNEFIQQGAIIDSFTTKAININNAISKEKGFEIYPNPAKDFVVIKSNEILGEATIEILNMNGTCLQSQKVTCQANKESKISLSNLSKGIYFVRILYNNHITIKRIVLQ